MRPKKIAVVAEWLTWRGGGEKVLDAILKAYPEADLFSTVYNEKKLPEYKKFNVKTTFLQKIPLVRQKHQLLPPLLLKAIQSIDLEGYDLIISLSSAIGKGIKRPAGAIHVSYCHTPMRYLWQPEIDKRLVRFPFGKYFMNYLKKWDLKTNDTVDYFLTNSRYTAARIKKFYKRDAIVIYPPATIRKKREVSKRDFFVCLGRLVEYKKYDLAVKAFNQLGKKLIVVGQGPQYKNLQVLAKDNIRILGRVSDAEKTKLLAEAKALIFPPEEDFGIVPLEAMSQGTPVIAYNKGGACESVIDGKTGLFFSSQTPEAIIEAVERFDTLSFKQQDLVRQAEFFSEENFIRNIKTFIEKIPVIQNEEKA